LISRPTRLPCPTFFAARATATQPPPRNEAFQARQSPKNHPLPLLITTTQRYSPNTGASPASSDVRCVGRDGRVEPSP